MKDDRVYLGRILRCISRIEEYTIEGREKFFSAPLIAGWRHPQFADPGGIEPAAQ